MKKRKCPIRDEVFSFRMEYLTWHLQTLHEKTVEDANETTRRTPVEVRKRSEINGWKNKRKKS